MTDKTITLEQIEALSWAVEAVDVGEHTLDTHEEAVSCDEGGEPVMETRYQSYLHGNCTLRSVERPKITYAIDWQANGGDKTLSGAYDFEIEVLDGGQNILVTDDLEILDGDGDIIKSSEAVHQIGNDIEQSLDWERKVHKSLPKMPEAEHIDTDTDEGKDMETIELSRDHGPDVRFQGEEIASASSYHFEGPRNIRWTELVLYRTAGGKFVCSEVGRTRWVGERTRYAAHIADSVAGLIDLVGHGWVAKDLYAAADIDATINID